MGWYKAEVLGNLNELHGDMNMQMPWNKNMDLWNNAVGRHIAITSKSKDEVARRVYEALRRGDLIANPETDTRIFNPLIPPFEGNSEPPKYPMFPSLSPFRAPRKISKSQRFCRHEKAAKEAAEKENAISTIGKIF